jgi:hypothetical protein
MCAHCSGYPCVPDHPGGVRYCTHCEDFIPITSFPSGPRRFVCKAHMKASAKRSTRKMFSNPQKRALHKVWARCYKDCSLFQQTGIGIKQSEIDQLLKVGVADEIEKNVGLYEKLARVIAVVPVDPTKLLCISNAALVSPSTRKLLVKRWKRFGKEEYSKLLEKELSYLSMNSIDHSDSEGSSDSNDDSDFGCTQRKPTVRSLEDHATDRDFLDTDSVMVALEDSAGERSFVETDCFMSDHF